MLRPTRNITGAASLAKVVARVAVAACLALSFFASLLPLRASADAGTMACCVGKAGHCKSGLLAAHHTQPTQKPKPKPEPMCGLSGNDEGAAITEDNSTAQDEPAVANETAVSDETPAEAAPDGLTIVAASSAAADESAAQTQDATKTSPPEATATPSLQRAITKPCPADCRAGTTGIVRQPRPREVALLAKGSRGLLPSPANWKSCSPETNLAAGATLKRSRPRGPPLPS